MTDPIPEEIGRPAPPKDSNAESRPTVEAEPDPEPEADDE